MLPPSWFQELGCCGALEDCKLVIYSSTFITLCLSFKQWFSITHFLINTYWFWKNSHELVFSVHIIFVQSFFSSREYDKYSYSWHYKDQHPLHHKRHIQLFDVNPQMWVYKAVCQIVFLVCTGLTWLTNNLQNLPDCHMQKIYQFFTKNKKRGRIFVFFSLYKH